MDIFVLSTKPLTNNLTMSSAQNETGYNDGTNESPTISQPLTDTASFPSAHSPSLVGSVIEASDGLGGSTYIRIQNISSTGAYLSVCCFVVLPRMPCHSRVARSSIIIDINYGQQA